MIGRYNLPFGLKPKLVDCTLKRTWIGATKSIPSPLHKYIVILLNPILACIYSGGSIYSETVVRMRNVLLPLWRTEDSSLLTLRKDLPALYRRSGHPSFLKTMPSM